MSEDSRKTAEKVIAFYLARAESARAMARKCRNLDEREQYLNIAFSWLTLAVESEQGTVGVMQSRSSQARERGTDPRPLTPNDGNAGPSSSTRVN